MWARHASEHSVGGPLPRHCLALSQTSDPGDQGSSILMPWSYWSLD